jgi:DNA-binding SARP family transcriptional activator/tetratricopeptide (TPR) repeat protein
LLGGFEARLLPGGTVRLPRRKARALLGYLALSRDGAAAREKLIALLWPDLPRARGHNSLRQTLFALRAALGPTASRIVATTPDTVALDRRAIDVDALAFERLAAAGDRETLERAAALYAGDLLEGLRIEATAFDGWLAARREQMRTVALGALQKVLSHQIEVDASEAALQTATKLLALDPLQEPVHCAVMRLHAREGRLAAALRQYEACVSVLQRELGAPPGAEIRQLYQRIRRRQLPEPGPAGRPEVPFVGRKLEWLRLRQALGAAWTRKGQVVAVLGEAGIGKSRLVEELAVEARRRHGRVAVGRCYETQQILPFGPWLDAVRHGRLLLDEEVVASLAPPWRLELSRLFPELARGPARGDVRNHPRLFDAFAHLLERWTASQPLLLIMEDLHWGDEMSIRLLGFIARRAPTLPLLAVLTAREEELRDVPVLQHVLRELDRDRPVTRLELPPLTRTDILTLVRTLKGRDRAAGVASLGEEIWSASAGNPFIAIETMQAGEEAPRRRRAGKQRLPPRVRTLVAERLDRLGARARHLALVAAVIERPFEPRLLDAAARLEEDPDTDGMEELLARRVLRERDGRFEFAHERIREIALEAIPAARRRLLHVQVAEALETLHAGKLEDHLASLGIHYLAGEAWEPAAAYLERAGDRAFSQGAQQALSALRALPEDRARLERMVDLLLDLRHALVPLGEADRIGQALSQAAEMAERLGDPRREGQVTTFQATLHWYLGKHDRGLELAERALEIGTAIDDGPLRVSATYLMGVIHHALGDYRRAVDLLLASTDAPAAGGLTSRHYGTDAVTGIFAAGGLARSLAELGDFDAARAHAERAVRLAEALHHPFVLVHAHVSLAIVHLRQGRLEALIPALEKLRDVNTASGALTVFPINDWFLSHAYALAGHPAAPAFLAETAHRTDSARFTFFYAFWLGLLGESCLLLGRPAEALGHARRAVALSRERHERGHEAWSLRLLGDVLSASDGAAVGDAEEAYRLALAIAADLRMKPLGERCRLGLGRLRPKQGRQAPRETDVGAARKLRP